MLWTGVGKKLWGNELKILKIGTEYIEYVKSVVIGAECAD